MDVKIFISKINAIVNRIDFEKSWCFLGHSKKAWKKSQFLLGFFLKQSFTKLLKFCLIYDIKNTIANNF